MRVYHFLAAEHALDDIRRRQIKIATFDTLNDPFELWAVSQPNRQTRKRLRNWKKTMSRKYGLLCFSRSWHNPLLWSHYADRHCGMALGFEIGDKLLRSVEYVKSRPSFKKVDAPMMEELLFTKFSDWEYEQEWRIYARLEDRDPSTGLYFADFSNNLVLREVICGPLCEATKGMIQASVREDHDVKLIKARLAFRSFRVVEDHRGLAAL